METLNESQRKRVIEIVAQYSTTPPLDTANSPAQLELAMEVAEFMYQSMMERSSSDADPITMRMLDALETIAKAQYTMMIRMEPIR